MSSEAPGPSSPRLLVRYAGLIPGRSPGPDPWLASLEITARDSRTYPPTDRVLFSMNRAALLSRENIFGDPDPETENKIIALLQQRSRTAYSNSRRKQELREALTPLLTWRVSSIFTRDEALDQTRALAELEHLSPVLPSTRDEENSGQKPSQQYIAFQLAA